MKTIAYFLPQFHTIPENDQWWGKGFTEWTNTRKSAPLFSGHYQPREPMNDFYYDLTDPNVRKWQAEIAKKYGIYGFCYYHYWFSGKRLLEKPLEALLELRDVDFPFCLSWANHTWNRSWTHEEKEVLQLQTYGDQSEWKEHFEYLVDFFKDSRYIKVDNKPLFVIYRPLDIPQCEERLAFYNQLARENGFSGIHFVETLHMGDSNEGCGINGFEAMVEFEPLFSMPRIYNRIQFYDKMWDKILNRERPKNKKVYLGGFPDWDNSARKKGNGLYFVGSTPQKFGKYMQRQMNIAKEIDSEFIFINAWNEWAEGAYLEPDKRYGLKYLENFKKALDGQFNENDTIDVVKHSNIIELVPSGAERILCANCKDTTIGKALSAKTDAVIFGTEKDRRYYKDAENNVNFFIPIDIEDEELTLGEKIFDVIILDEALERSRDPWKLLNNVKKYLKEKGNIIVSVKNVGNVRILRNLLSEGTWEANNNESSKGDTRYYTKTDFITMAESLGYSIVEMKTESSELPVEGKKFINTLVNECKRSMVNAKKTLEEIEIERYVFLLSYGQVTTKPELYKDINKLKKRIEEMINTGMNQEALNLISKNEEIIKDDVDILSMKSIIHIVLNQYEVAEETLVRGLSISKDNLDLSYNLAYVYYLQGKYEEAKKYYEKTVQLSNDPQLSSEIEGLLEKINLSSQKKYRYNKKYNIYIYNNESVPYKDGSEDYLYSVFNQNPDIDENPEKAYNYMKDWASRYHLTNMRKNILEPLFQIVKKEANVLELGGGIGALTYPLAKNFKSVDVIEGSISRAIANKTRNRNNKNVRMFVNDLNNLQPPKDSYDLITLIGVMEYLPYFNDSGDAKTVCVDFLKRVNKALDDQGILAIAIENKLGAKYFSGCPEDHNGDFFSGIIGYPNKSAVTFSRHELIQLLESSGFSNIQFYHAFPDYKLPTTIIKECEKMYEFDLASICRGLFEDYHGKRKHLMPDTLLLNTLKESKLIHEFSNSFLVLCSKDAINLETEEIITKFWNKDSNKSQYHHKMKFYDRGNKKVIERISDRNNIYHNSKLEFQLLNEDIIPGESLIIMIYQGVMKKDNYKDLINLLKFIHNSLLVKNSKSKIDEDGYQLVSGACIDYAYNNLVINNGQLEFIDRKWTYKQDIPEDYVIFRNLCSLYAEMSPYLKEGTLSQFVIRVMREIFVDYDIKRFNKNIEQDAVFLSEVMVPKYDYSNTINITPIDFSHDDVSYSDGLIHLQENNTLERNEVRLINFDENDFCIKSGYVHNANPEYFEDTTNDFTYQPDVYDLAYYLAERCNVSYIIDVGSGNGKKLKKFVDQYKVICIDYGSNLDLLNRNISVYKFIEANLEEGLPYIDMDVLNKSIIIMSDVIEHIINPEQLLLDLRNLSHISPYVLISTPDRNKVRGVRDFGPPVNKSHVREWAIDEFDLLLKKYKFHSFMLGHTVNTDFHLQKNNILALTGKFVYESPPYKVSVLAIINVYNESDIIEQVVNHLLEQGVNVHIVDNWSTDGTYEKIENLSKHNSRIKLQRFPEKPPQYYEWEALLKNTEKIASESEYDWVIHYDADEIRESPWSGVTIADAISYIDSRGFNAIDFTVIDFRPTGEDNYKFGDSVQQKLSHFEFGKRSGHFVQVKGWKNIKGRKYNLASSGGHNCLFQDRKIYPIKFLNRHYPLRNQSQAKKKIFQERVNRFSPVEKNVKGWHVQYDQYTPEDMFVWKQESLIYWDRKFFEMEYFVERISGVGIVRTRNK